MYICSNCGKQYENAASFCGVCGKPVVPMQPPVAPAPPVTPPPAAPYVAPAPAAPYTAPAAPYTAPTAPYSAPAAPYTAPEPAAPYVAPAPAPAPTAAAPADGKSFLPTLFNFIGNVCSIIAGFFAMMALAIPYIYVDINTSYYGSYYYASTSFHADETCSVFAFIFAFASMGFAAFNFVFALIKHADLNAKFSKITNLVLGTLLFVLAITLLTTL